MRIQYLKINILIMGIYEIVNKLKNKEIDGNDLLKMYENQEISKEFYDKYSKDYPPGATEDKTAVENNQTDQTNVNTSDKDLDLGSNIYSNIASIFGIIYAVLGFFSGIFIGGVEGFTFLIGFAILGVFLYLSISWFGRVLKGLEQNNKLLKEILKK